MRKKSCSLKFCPIEETTLRALFIKHNHARGKQHLRFFSWEATYNSNQSSCPFVGLQRPEVENVIHISHSLRAPVSGSLIINA